MNEYKILGDITELYLTYKEDKLICTIDTEDLNKVLNLGITFHARWSDTANSFYATSHLIIDRVRVGFHLHRVICNISDLDHLKIVANHKDFNGLNNRKSNLEVVTRTLNQLHCKPKANKKWSTGFGVTIKGRKRFISAGYFDDPYKAHLAVETKKKEIMNKLKQEMISPTSK